MKFIIASFFLITTLVNIGLASTITPLNNTQSILYAFPQFANFSTDIIVDSLARNGKYTIITMNGDTVNGKAEDYYSYNDDTEIYKSSFYLDTLKNTIRIESYYIRGGGGTYISEYKLLNSVHKAKFIYTSYAFASASTIENNPKIYDYNPQNNTFTLDTISSNLFHIEEKDFYMELTPSDSTLPYYGAVFHLVYNGEGIATCLLDNGRWTPFEEIRNNKWLKGNIIRFDYINDEFIRSEPYWDNDD